MTNSEADHEADAILQRFLERLDEERVRREIDDPIDRILEGLVADSEQPFSREAFHRTIADFMKKIHADGLRVKQSLTDSEALAEAIALLESGYERDEAKGYEAACLVASDPQRNGMHAVVEEIALLVKAREKAKYLEWAVLTLFDPFDWQTRCRVAKRVVERLNAGCAAPVLQAHPEQLAQDVQTLLLAFLQIERSLP